MSVEKVVLRDQLRARYGRVATGVDTSVAGPPPRDDGLDLAAERAFVLHAASGRTIITAPVREVAAANPAFTYLNGRLVGADQPNGNGAMWSTEDLQIGEGSVAGGPLNWLHDDNKIIGCLLDGRLVAGREAAAEGLATHITSKAAVWSFLFPQESRTIAHAAADGQLYYSMECISRQVACVDGPGRPGCGETFTYADADAGRCCTHIREKSSVRRFIDPLFLGAAVIVPPVQPGWDKANVELARQAAALAEENILDTSVEVTQARDIAAAILGWANR